jgi:phage/plasmid-like protein (TIGR03299 family)
MSHELEIIEGVASFVSAREDAWHRLGHVLDHTFDAAEAMEKARLANWNVRKIPLFAPVELADGSTIQLPADGRYATIRDNPVDGMPNYLGDVGEKYHPIQNEDHIDLLNALVDESGAHFETAGSLRGGSEVFITMKMPDTIMIGGVDPLTTNLAALNSHNGNSSFRFLVTQTRIVCANTQAAALHDATSQFAIRHTSGSTNELQQAREALGLTFKYIDEFQQAAERMIQETMAEDEFMDIIESIWEPLDKPSKAQQETTAIREVELNRLFLESDTMQNVKGTRWAGYQAVTEYVDHFSTIRGVEGEDLKDRRALRTLTSPLVARIKEQAFDLCAV